MTTVSMFAFPLSVLALLGGGAFTQSGGRPSAPGVSLRFEDYELDKAPRGFTAARTGAGEEGVWVVKEDASSPAGPRVLAQTSTDETNGRYPICVFDGFTAQDVTASVKFRALQGAVDRAAGIVVRCQDKDNYYVVRANCLEDNVRLYHVTQGKRVQFAGVDHFPVKEGEWHALKLEAKGTRFKVWYDGKLLFEADDATIVKPGRAGIWTKADSVTHFDDFEAREAGAEEAAPVKSGATFDFEATPVDGAPAGFTAVAAEGAAAEWFAVHDATKAAGSRVVSSRVKPGAAPASGPGRRAQFLFADGVLLADGVVRFRFRTVKPASPNDPGFRTAGVVFRYKDKDDHYVLRVNTREDNAQLHRVHGGKRKQIAEIHHKTIAEGEWHAIEVHAEGAKIRVRCDGELLLEGLDNQPAITGGVGLTGSSDATTYYDDVAIEPAGGTVKVER
jgi:hypothetical protein